MAAYSTPVITAKSSPLTTPSSESPSSASPPCVLTEDGSSVSMNDNLVSGEPALYPPALHSIIPPLAVYLRNDRVVVRLAVPTLSANITSSVQLTHTLCVRLTQPTASFSLRFPYDVQSTVSVLHASSYTDLIIQLCASTPAPLKYVYLCPFISSKYRGVREIRIPVGPTSAYCSAFLDAQADAPVLAEPNAAYPFGFALRFTAPSLSNVERVALSYAVLLPNAESLPPWRRPAARSGLEDRDLDLSRLQPNILLATHPHALRAPPPVPTPREVGPPLPPPPPHKHLPLQRPRDHKDAAAVVTAILCATFVARRATGSLCAGSAFTVAQLAPPIAALDSFGDVVFALRGVARRALVYGPLRAPRLPCLAASDVAALLATSPGAARAAARAWLKALRCWFGALYPLAVFVVILFDPLLRWLDTAPESVIASWAEDVHRAVEDYVTDVSTLEWPAHLIYEACERQALNGVQAVPCDLSPVKAERNGPPSVQTTTSSPCSDGTTSSQSSASHGNNQSSSSLYQQ